MKNVSKANFKELNISINKLKAMSDQNRIRILYLLSCEKICVCDIAKSLNLAQNLVSFHLNVLFESGLLDKKREGNCLFYFIKKEYKKSLNYFFKFLNLI